MSALKKNIPEKLYGGSSESALSMTATSIVHIRNGFLVTDSLAIAQAFGRRHDNVLASIDELIADGDLNHLDFKVVEYADRKGEMRRAIELTQRAALFCMPFIGGRQAKKGQMKFVDAFLMMRERLGQQLAEWHEMRKKASASYRLMCEALQESRKLQNKVTLPHHYMTEAKLVNWAVFGRFEGINRDRLTPADLMLVEEVEAQNAIWVALGRSYDTRKAELAAFALSMRTKKLNGVQLASLAPQEQ